MFKVLVRGVGEHTWSGNQLTFDTVEDARTYAIDLFGRWFGIDAWAVVRVSDDAGRMDDAQVQAVAIEAS